jgi:hypothetical protein
VRTRTRLVTAVAATSLLLAACEGDVPEAEDAEFETVEEDPGADPDIDATDPDDPGEPEGGVAGDADGDEEDGDRSTGR